MQNFSRAAEQRLCFLTVLLKRPLSRHQTSYLFSQAWRATFSRSIAVQDLQIMMLLVSHSGLDFILSKIPRVGAGTSTQMGHASSRFSLHQMMLDNYFLTAVADEIVDRKNTSCQ